MSDRPTLRLRFLHNRLDRAIEHEQGRRAPDRFRIVKLKKLKLAIKDRIVRQGAPRSSPA